jgi:oxaloacetate decarboxylase alpha subunit
MDLKELRALLRLLDGTDVEELEVEEGGRRVRIRKRSADAPAPLRPAAAQPSASLPAPAAGVAAETSGLVPVVSPMVGTFYRAPAPGAEPYVKEGDVIRKGTVVCIVEAMKLMNEIESEVAGRVVKIAAENGEPVEFGSTLFLVDPA